MISKTGEQGSVRLARAHGGKIAQKSVLYVSIPAGLNVSDEAERLHVQGHALPRWSDFSWGKAYSSAQIVEEKTSLSEVISDGTSREVCDLRMNV